MIKTKKNEKIKNRLRGRLSLPFPFLVPIGRPAFLIGTSFWPYKSARPLITTSFTDVDKYF
jgi:hypothetical protein